MAFSVETALCIVVPESLTSWIQQCRSQHDRAYKRWPPHINLLFPFIPEKDFAAQLPRIKEAVAKLPKIQLKLHQTSFFKHGPRKWVLVLKPEEVVPGSLDTLQMTVFKLYPHLSKQRDVGGGKFVPHVSLGQFETQAAMEAKMAELAECPALEFELDAICLIARQGDLPFEVKHKAELGTNVGPPSGSGPSSSAVAPSSRTTRQGKAAAAHDSETFGGLFSSQSIAISDFPASEPSEDSTADSWLGSWSDPTPEEESGSKRRFGSKTKPKTPSKSPQPFKSSYYKDKPSPLTSSPSKAKSPLVSTTTSPTPLSSAGFSVSPFQLSTTSVSPSPTSKFMTNIEPPSAPKFSTTFSTMTTSFSTPTTASSASSSSSSFVPSKPPAPIVLSQPAKTEVKPKTSSYYATKKTRIGRESTLDASPLPGSELSFDISISTSNEIPYDPEPAPVTHKLISGRVAHPMPVESEFEPVVHKILQWLTTMEAARRPKSRQKLGNAISKMCSITCDGLAPGDMFNRLQSKGYFKCTGDKVQILKKGDKSTQRYNLGLAHQIQYASDEAAVEDRCANWLMDPDNMPRTKAALMNTIVQMVKIKKSIDPSAVIQYLAECGHISVLQDEKAAEFLEYHL